MINMAELSQQYADLLQNVKAQPSKFFWQSPPEDSMKAIEKYISGSQIHLVEPPDQVAKKLYNDIAGYSVLTDPLHDVWVRRIQVLSWDKISIQFINGEKHQIDGFPSPALAQSVIRKIIQDFGAGAAGAGPGFSGKLKNGLRLTVFFPPAVPSEIGVRCNIRKEIQRDYTEETYSANDFASKRELSCLDALLRYGISLLIVGKPGAGKTTFMRYLLSELSGEGMDVVTIDDKQEINVGTLLSPSDSVLTDHLLQYASGLEPDVIGCNIDDSPVWKASLQGNAIIAASPAFDPGEALYQMSSGGIPLDRLARAFPVIVFLRIFRDGKFRIAGIFEHVLGGQKQPELKTIWEFRIKEKTGEKLIGVHQQVNDLSENIFSRMRFSGLSPVEEQKIRKDYEDAERCSNRPAGSGSAAPRDQKERSDL